MDASVLAAALYATSALTIAAVTYALTKRRERQAEWRQFKLGYYREYIAALSGITEASLTPENQRRYADAANNLSLVALPIVLRTLYELQDMIASGRRESHDVLLSALLRAIRRDVQPSTPNDADLTFRLFAAPPAASLRAE